MKITIRNSFIALALAVLVATIGILYSLGIPAHESFGDSSYPNIFPTMSVVTGIAVGPQVSTRVLATSTARLYAYLSNASATAVECNLSDASSTVTNGLAIGASGGSYHIDQENLYTGSIQCSASASTTLLVTARQ